MLMLEQDLQSYPVTELTAANGLLLKQVFSLNFKIFVDQMNV